MKKVIRLTESDIHNIIKKSVNKILREFGSDGPDFEDMPYEYRNEYYEFDDLDLGMYESKVKMGRIIRESIKKVLNESPKSTDPDNVVPENVAIKYGFTLEYGGGQDGLELWGRDVIRNNGNHGWNKKPGWDSEEDLDSYGLLKALGIRRFTTMSKSPNGVHVRITVQPDPKRAMRNGWGRRPRINGDYVATGYGNENGEFFHNPKNGHNKQF